MCDTCLLEIRLQGGDMCDERVLHVSVHEVRAELGVLRGKGIKMVKAGNIDHLHGDVLHEMLATFRRYTHEDVKLLLALVSSSFALVKIKDQDIVNFVLFLVAEHERWRFRACLLEFLSFGAELVGIFIRQET